MIVHAAQREQRKPFVVPLQKKGIELAREAGILEVGASQQGRNTRGGCFTQERLEDAPLERQTARRLLHRCAQRRGRIAGASLVFVSTEPP